MLFVGWSATLVVLGVIAILWGVMSDKFALPLFAGAASVLWTAWICAGDTTVDPGGLRVQGKWPIRTPNWHFEPERMKSVEIVQMGRVFGFPAWWRHWKFAKTKFAFYGSDHSVKIVLSDGKAILLTTNLPDELLAAILALGVPRAEAA